VWQRWGGGITGQKRERRWVGRAKREGGMKRRREEGRGMQRAVVVV
jgi:hypothetical protein